MVPTAPNPPPSIASRVAPPARPVRWFGAVIGLHRAVVDERPAPPDLDDEARMAVTGLRHHGRIIAPRDIPRVSDWPLLSGLSGPAANPQAPDTANHVVRGNHPAPGAVILDRDHRIAGDTDTKKGNHGYPLTPDRCQRRHEFCADGRGGMAPFWGHDNLDVDRTLAPRRRPGLA